MYGWGVFILGALILPVIIQKFDKINVPNCQDIVIYQNKVSNVIWTLLWAFLVLLAWVLFPVSYILLMLYLWQYKIRKNFETENKILAFCCALLVAPVAAAISSSLALSFAFICLVTLQLGILLISGSSLYVFRMIENVVEMSIITLFAFNSEINCSFCVDSGSRSALTNDRIMTWIVIGWVATCIHIITSCFVSKMIRKDYEYSYKQIMTDS